LNYNAKMTQSLTVPIYVTVSTALAALIITGIHTVVELVEVKCVKYYCGFLTACVIVLCSICTMGAGVAGALICTYMV